MSLRLSRLRLCCRLLPSSRPSLALDENNLEDLACERRRLKGDKPLWGTGPSGCGAFIFSSWERLYSIFNQSNASRRSSGLMPSHEICTKPRSWHALYRARADSDRDSALPALLKAERSTTGIELCSAISAVTIVGRTQNLYL